MTAVNQTERYTLDHTIMRWKFREWLEAGLVGRAGSSIAPKDYVPPTAYSAPKSDTDASGAPTFRAKVDEIFGASRPYGKSYTACLKKIVIIPKEYEASESHFLPGKFDGSESQRLPEIFNLRLAQSESLAEIETQRLQTLWEQ